MFSRESFAIAWILFILPNFLLAQLKVGSPAPEIFITHWIDNIPVNKDLKNKFVVIDFWATWCAPCLESVPHMNSLVEKYKSRKDLIFLALTSERKDKVDWLLKKVPFSSIVVADTTHKTNNGFKIDLIPTVVVIDDKNQIKWMGQDGLTSEILEKILKGENPVVANEAASITLPSQQKQITDSIQQRYTQYFMDDDLKEYFNLGPLTTGEKRMNMKGMEKMLVVGIPLREELAFFLKASANQIILPETLSSKLISYIYKGKATWKDQEIFGLVLDKLNLKFKKVDTLVDVMELEIENEKLFSKFLSDSIPKISRSSNSDSYAAIENSNFSFLKKDIENKFNTIIVYKGEESFGKKMSLTLSIESLTALKASLRSYGIGSKLIKKQIVAYLFEKAP